MSRNLRDNNGEIETDQAAEVLKYLQASWGVAAPMMATKLAVLMMLPPARRPFDSSTGF